MNATPQRISLGRLFLLFLKLGATAFGGNVALVATVRRELCDRRKLLADEEVLDALSLGSVLPGALATNVIAFTGYRMRGLLGAAVALVGILLPSFILICTVAELYFRYGSLPAVQQVLKGLVPGVCGLIFATAIQLALKNIRYAAQWLLAGLAAAALMFMHGFYTTVLVMSVTGAFGIILFRQHVKEPEEKPAKIRFPRTLFIAAAVVAALIGIAMIGAVSLSVTKHPQLVVLSRMSSTFGGMSLTLFGGGYVFVPAIGKVVVELHHWVTAREFADGIAFGQVTPGPIMISAAFIGWKVSGFWGAFISTLFIFLPPALVMLIASHFLERIRGNKLVEALFLGLRAGVIGMIFAAVVYIGKDAAPDWQAWVVFAAAAFAVLKFNADSAIVIPAAGVLGYLLYLI